MNIKSNLGPPKDVRESVRKIIRRYRALRYRAKELERVLTRDRAYFSAQSRASMARARKSLLAVEQEMRQLESSYSWLP